MIGGRAVDEQVYDLLVKLYERFNKRFDKVDGRLVNIDGRLGNVEGRLSKLEMKIDGEITDKIRALFDDREVIHEKLDNIQVDINNLSMKTANHDNRIIELSRRIR